MFGDYAQPAPLHPGVERVSGTSVRATDLEPEADGGPNLPARAFPHGILNPPPDTNHNSPKQRESYSYSGHEVWTCPVCGDMREERVVAQQG